MRGGVCEGIVWCTQFQKAAGAHDQHARTLQHAAQSVRHEHHRAATEGAADRVQDQPLGLWVQVGGRLVY